ncbi:hypothetical protein DLR41_27475 [Salmonella enterica subsp. enterica serovar Panama]|nr:hypothetical protein [Salmonella enterica subsp. enterica serovar Panama]
MNNAHLKIVPKIAPEKIAIKAVMMRVSMVRKRYAKVRKFRYAKCAKRNGQKCAVFTRESQA